MVQSKPRVVVIGLDGAVPEIIDRLIAAGELPNIAGVYRRGVHGILRSTVPAISAPAWASFMTGVNPGKHGIFGFEGRVPGSYRTKLMSSTDLKTTNVWEHLSAHGKRVAAVNVVMSYPPMPVNGVMISGFLAPMEALVRNFTYPPEMADGLIKRGYKVEPEVLIYQSKQKYVDEVFSVMEKHAEIALELLDQEGWDCFMVVFTSVDRLQHRFWQYMEPEEFDVKKSDVARFGSVIEDCYRACDRLIGQVLAKAGPETHVALMSDHGFARATTNFNIHNWLVELGLMKVKVPGRKKLLLSRYRWLARNMGRLGLLRIVNYLRSHFPSLFRGMTSQFKIHDVVDWANTKVFVVEKALYVNLKGRDPQGTVEPGSEYEALREMLASKLLEVRDPFTGQQVVEKVMKGEDVYHGGESQYGGDLLIRFRKGYRHWPRLEPGAPVISKERLFCSYHHDQDEGFFALQGPGVRKGETLEASIMDVSPTVMHLLDVPLPEGTDGRPITGAFEPGSSFATREVQMGRETAARLKVRDAIRGLKAAGRI